jgi:hypothetical protein
VLVVAVPCAVAAACAYGAGTAVQQTAASADARREHGHAGPARLLGDRRWLAGQALSLLALLLQVVALATGPVVLVQPCLVLALPVSLLVAWWLGAGRPSAAQYRACGWIFAGLGAFFAVVGSPADASPLGVAPAVVTGVIVAVAVAGIVYASRQWSRRWRAAALGLVAGCCAGFAAVLLDAAAADWEAQGLRALTDPGALATEGVLILAAAAAVVLLQAAFQVDALSSSYPFDLTANPIIAVVLGVALLHEGIPHGPRELMFYGICLAAVTFGSLRLVAKGSAVVVPDPAS